MNEDEMQQCKEFFKKRLKRDAKEFVDAVLSLNVGLTIEFVKLAYAVGVKDGIIEAYSKDSIP